MAMFPHTRERIGLLSDSMLPGRTRGSRSVSTDPDLCERTVGQRYRCRLFMRIQTCQLLLSTFDGSWLFGWNANKTRSAIQAPNALNILDDESYTVCVVAGQHVNYDRVLLGGRWERRVGKGEADREKFGEKGAKK